MMGGRDWDDWIAQYQKSHRNRWNRLTHLFGIPMIILGIALGLLALLWPGLWITALSLFVIGWALQFLGHAIEGERPEFFKDWRFLFVGTRWWWKKVSGRI